MTKGCNHNVTANKRLLTLKECVEVYGISLWFWRSRIWDGSIPHLRAGRKLVLDRIDIENFLQKQKVRNHSG